MQEYEESDVDAESSVYDTGDNVAANKTSTNNDPHTTFQRHFSTGTTLTETDCDGDSVVDVNAESIYDQNPSLHAGSVSGWERQDSSETDYALIGEGNPADDGVDADAGMDSESDYELSVQYSHGAARGRIGGGTLLQTRMSSLAWDSEQEDTYATQGDIGEC